MQCCKSDYHNRSINLKEEIGGRRSSDCEGLERKASGAGGKWGCTDKRGGVRSETTEANRAR